MRVEVYDNLSDVQRVSDDWSALCRRCDDAPVFALPQWHCAWWETIGRDRQMRIVAAYDGERLAGILALSIRRRGVVRVLEFSGGSQSDEHDLVVDPEDGDAVRRALAPVMDELRRFVDVVQLQNIPADSPTVAWLAARYRSYSTASLLPRLKLNRPYAELQMQWRSSHRRDVNRQRRRLEKEGLLSLNVIRDTTQARETLSEFFEVYRRKWVLDGKTKVLRDPLLRGPLQRFYGALIEALVPTKILHFSVVTLDRQPISYHFGFLHGGRLYWYRPTYDKRYENFSPSKVHISMLLQLGCDEGWEEFDFLIGAENYKHAWTSDARKGQSVVFHGRRAPWDRLAAWWVGKGRATAASRLRRYRGCDIVAGSASS